MMIVSAFYKFFSIEPTSLEQLRSRLQALGVELGARGLVLIAPEGVNGQFSGNAFEVAKFKEILAEVFSQPQFEFKDNPCYRHPFRMMKVEIRDSIVYIGKDNLVPSQEFNHHLTPSQWNEVLENQEDVVVLDTRNTYESQIGKFRQAICPPLGTFNEFPDYVRNANLPKDKKILMYCTGGIRCEKAILEMQRQGYQNVYQLAGGILKYLEEYPDKYYEGECFVFDRRVSVDQSLAPSSVYRSCRYCGNAGKETAKCCKCGGEVRSCLECLKKQAEPTCSKNCGYHVERLRNNMSA